MDAPLVMQTGMDILNFLTASPNTAFLVAGCIVLALLVLGIVSLMIGVGSELFHFSGDIDFTLDANGNGIPDYLEIPPSHIMGWINPGQVPSTIFIILFCGTLSITGYSLQWIYLDLFTKLASGMLAVPIAVAITLPVVSYLSATIAPFLPKDETNAVSLDSLIGSSGKLTAGPINSNIGGIARFTDFFGTDHNLVVYGETQEDIDNGSPVVLLRPHQEHVIAYVVRKIQ